MGYYSIVVWARCVVAYADVILACHAILQWEASVAGAGWFVSVSFYTARVLEISPCALAKSAPITQARLDLCMSLV